MTRREYENATPVDDAMTVLDLLTPSWGDDTVRTLQRWPHAPPHVEVRHVRDFGDDEVRRFLVKDETAAELLASGWIEGTPRWGYTDRRELVPSGRGKDHLWKERHRLGDFPRALTWFEPQ